MQKSLLVILSSVFLSGCVSLISHQVTDVIAGLISMAIGILLFYAGKNLAVKTSLEKWSMKLILVGVVVFLLG